MNWKYPRDEWLDTYKQEQTTYGTISPVTSVGPWSVKAGLIKYHPETPHSRGKLRSEIQHSTIYTVVCEIVHKIASVWCKIALGEVGVLLP